MPPMIAKVHREGTMGLLSGIVLFVAGIGLTFLGRPGSGGEYVVPLMRVWVVGQIYVLATLIALVIGCTLIISNWP
jgi:hypothetical protein